MTERPLRILEVSTADIAGGAEKVAWNLFRAYRARGYDAWLAVGRKQSDHPDVFVIPDHDMHGRWSGFWWGVHYRLQSLDRRIGHAWRLSRLARALAEFGGLLDACRGVEDFRFPGTWRLLRLTPQAPDIVHCHNLHGSYFDLRALPWLGQRVPVILTPHDAWLLSGHCAHSFDCERWKTGCGHCPDLTIPPAIRRDATAYNWQRKRAIYAKSRLYVASPSRWLMQKVEQSMLAPAVVEARVIPNGVDRSVFHPADTQVARAALGIPQNATVLLFTAHGVRGNIWKDYRTMRAAVALVAERLGGQGLLFITLGEDAPAEPIGQAEVRFIRYQEDPQSLARYYQAADLYLHAAHVETFPLTILVALACGTPVVATAVGGIPEQVKGLQVSGLRLGCSDLNRYGNDGATGMLIPPRDPMAMAVSIEQLLKHEALRQALGKNAARDIRNRFDLNHQADEYLAWYREVSRRPTQGQNSAACNVSHKER